MVIRSKPIRVMIASAIGGALFLTGCSVSENAAARSQASQANGLTNVALPEGSPVDGGTLSYATYSDVTTLDPVTGNPFGTTGGTEMAAIYGLLIRYDFQTRQFVPKLAESLNVDESGLRWTLKLRPGITFSDGTPLDAEAVRTSIDRYNSRRGIGSNLWTSGVEKTDVIDPLTLVFGLYAPWPGIQSMLALGHGMVVAPSADTPNGFTPIGAGAFTVQSFAPHEQLVLQRRNDYWGPEPHLEQLRFVSLAGEQPKLDALQSGGVDAIFIRNPEVVSRAQGAHVPGFAETTALGSIVQINNRPGHPGSDIRIRKALALAIDPEVVNQRAWGGQGLPGTEIFQSDSTWHNEIPPLEPNSGEARTLLDAAKSNGYDGRITYLTQNEPTAQNQALAIQAMLQAVGFDVTVEFATGPGDVLRKVHVEHDFDLAAGGWNLLDAAPFMRLQNNLASDSSNNNLGFNESRMDELLRVLRSSDTDVDSLKNLTQIQGLVDETVPFVTLGATRNFIAWNEAVHGIEPSLDGILLFENAWVER